MGPTRFSRLRVLAGALLMVVSCAGTPKPSPSPPRAKDTPPEKVAAQRAAAPHSINTLEQDEERWEFDAARERRQQEETAKARKTPAASDKAVQVTPAPSR